MDDAIIECSKATLAPMFVVFQRKERRCSVHERIWVVVKYLTGLIPFKSMICKETLIDSFFEKAWESKIIFCGCILCRNYIAYVYTYPRNTRFLKNTFKNQGATCGGTKRCFSTIYKIFNVDLNIWENVLTVSKSLSVCSILQTFWGYWKIDNGGLR